MKRFVVLVAAAAFLTALISGAQPSVPLADPPEFNILNIRCEMDLTRMRLQIDPIVQPGVKPSAHLHDFKGAIVLDENMRANDTLPVSTRFDPGYYVNGRLPSSTCRIYGLWPVYWMPTAKLDGQNTPAVTDPNSRQVKSSWMLVTHRSRPGEKVLPAPYGMAMVVGNAKATRLSEQDKNVRWSCGGMEGSRRPIDCTDLGEVTAVVTFPDCWNGRYGWGGPNSTLAEEGIYAKQMLGWDAFVPQPVAYDTNAGIGPDNFTYGTDAGCPAGFHRIAQIVLRQHFSEPSTNAPLVDPYDEAGNLRLSFVSGPFYTFHADAWVLYGKQPYVQRVAKCLNGEVFPFSQNIDCDDGLR